MNTEGQYVITNVQIEKFGDYVEDDDNHTEEKYKNARGLAGTIRINPISDEIKKVKNNLLDKIDACLLECAYLDDRISGEGGCPGTRNGEYNCDTCQYFTVDVSCLKSTIESMRDDAE
ncbi:MAG: hypothetical protein WCX79_00580 [Candidatus Paceibacterota bacterium]|jgi:hypothetical protein